MARERENGNRETERSLVVLTATLPESHAPRYVGGRNTLDHTVTQGREIFRVDTNPFRVNNNPCRINNNPFSVNSDIGLLISRRTGYPALPPALPPALSPALPPAFTHALPAPPYHPSFPPTSNATAYPPPCWKPTPTPYHHPSPTSRCNYPPTWSSPWAEIRDEINNPVVSITARPHQEDPGTNFHPMPGAERLIGDISSRLGMVQLDEPHAGNNPDIRPNFAGPVVQAHKEKNIVPAHSSQVSATSPTCIICYEPLHSPGTQQRMSASCLHKPSVCNDCMSKTIKADLERKTWDQIKCPDCGSLLAHEDIRRFADTETMARYEQMSFQSAVSRDPDFVWCQQCDSGQIHETGKSQPIVTCVECGFRTCFSHAVPWHYRLTCEEYDEMLRDPDGFRNQREVEEEETLKERKLLEQRRKEDKLSVATIKKTTKQCPGCSWPIEKNEGCRHMTCIRCGHEFCWACLSDYKKIRAHGNSRHQRSCPDHSANLQ